MVLVLACLGLKTAFLSRDKTINYIVESLAFVLRVPERKSLSCYLLFGLNICHQVQISQ